MTALNPGSHLGPYEILAQIGAGGMGEVWKARDTRLDRIVAIKVSHEEFSERFEREARAVAALNHPHVCTLVARRCTPGFSNQSKRWADRYLREERRRWRRGTTGAVLGDTSCGRSAVRHSDHCGLVGQRRHHLLHTNASVRVRPMVLPNQRRSQTAKIYRAAIGPIARQLLS
ncbi:MAG: hypothetical protein DMG14_23710 [Acidobacteria bacterium]|nr:MAG: hypothetical protein DMG14_23710 [Acidobacteriota bacterium]